ncbi:MAG: S-adenosyl-l-methionine hydroxide adenosyltransferase family protein [Spirochaetaceae bacterium]|jgi:S-adenosylmethionine hydrolase|nr:S-adenosyl-l-methionine hydroxide adenosyltransferase family protein [Spirochaetaceae bacterium]
MKAQKFIISILFCAALGFTACGAAGSAAKAGPQLVVFQSDFGLKDGAVSAMKGVAMGVSGSLKLFDLTHEIPPYSIWDAAYRLYQTAEYWSPGTVFVSIVDPGVGTERLSVVLKTKSGHYFVTPDNGTLTLVAEKFGIEEVRQIDEAVNRRKDSEKSYTFHGRDVYAYTGARLASGAITFEQVGQKLPAQVEKIPYEKARLEGATLFGAIPALDIQYGNVWTNIARETAQGLNIETGSLWTVEIFEGGKPVFKDVIPFANSFGDVPEGKNLMYYNSLDSLSFAINMDDFATTYNIGYGGEWSVRITKQ